MANMFSKEFIETVDRHKMTFLLIVLLLANGYQYIRDGNKMKDMHDENKALNEKIQDLTYKNLEYEKIRSERLEYLLNNLSKNPVELVKTKPDGKQ